MVVTVTRELCTLTKTNERYATKASTIGLTPGNWPATIETTLGNGTPFVRNGRIDGGYFYIQMKGTASLIVAFDQ